MSQFADFEIDIDTTDAKEFDGAGGGGPELPPGEFLFDVVDMVKATSKAGNAMVNVTFEVAEGEYQGVKVLGYYSLSDKAKGRIKTLQIACGARTDKIRTSEIMGARIRATVIHNEAPPMMGQDGTPMPPRVFAKVTTERPLEDAAPVQATPPPPVTRAKTAAANGAARRA